MASAPHPSISPAQHQSEAASKFTIVLKPLSLGLPTFFPPAPQTDAIVGKKRAIPQPSSHKMHHKRRFVSHLPCSNTPSPTRHQLSASGQDDDGQPATSPLSPAFLLEPRLTLDDKNQLVESEQSKPRSPQSIYPAPPGSLSRPHWVHLPKTTHRPHRRHESRVPSPRRS